LKEGRLSATFRLIRGAQTCKVQFDCNTHNLTPVHCPISLTAPPSVIASGKLRPSLQVDAKQTPALADSTNFFLTSTTTTTSFLPHTRRPKTDSLR
jgi:hypothetical protein